MQIATASGIIKGSKRSRYMHWLQGRVDSGAFTGVGTVSRAWCLVADEVSQTDTFADAYRIGFLQQRIYDAGRRAARQDYDE